MPLKTRLNIVYTVIGVLIGIWHLYMGSMAIFVFRENEPLLSWLTIFLGPLLTFPAFLIGFRAPLVATWCLFVGATSSLFFMVMSEGLQGDHLLRFAVFVSLPMYALAALSFNRLHFGLHSK
jgi:hypothetical protein